MKLHTQTHQLKLKYTFGISRESFDTKPTFIAILEQDGHFGYGESTENTYYDASIENITAAVESLRDRIENFDFGAKKDPFHFYDEVVMGTDNMFARNALDLAAHDLYGKLQGKPTYALWGLPKDKGPISNYTIGLDSLDTMIQKLKDNPWPLYKIKLGTDDDIRIVEELRKHTNSMFRIDANCAWTADQTIDFSHKLRALGVEFIEQPMQADADPADLKRVYTDSALPLIADESCIVSEDVRTCHGLFHGINIKLCKCGGLTPALGMIQAAKTNGMQTMVGCMTESTVGISAVAQLLPVLDYVDMDGALLLAEDIADGVKVNSEGKAVFPEVNGNGVTLL